MNKDKEYMGSSSHLFVTCFPSNTRKKININVNKYISANYKKQE